MGLLEEVDVTASIGHVALPETNKAIRLQAPATVPHLLKSKSCLRNKADLLEYSPKDKPDGYSVEAKQARLQALNAATIRAENFPKQKCVVATSCESQPFLQRVQTS